MIPEFSKKKRPPPGTERTIQGSSGHLPVVQRMCAQARPDLLVWGQVIPDPTVSNIARELVFEAGLEPTLPAYSTVLACSTSFMATLQAAGLIGRSDMHLALVGGGSRA